jgi:transcriptional regulator with XRE-family HTH domain
MPKKRPLSAAPTRRSALSAVLTTLRILRGKTQAEVARAAGVRRSALSACEAEGVDPGAEAVGRIAPALGVSRRIVAALEDLFDALGSLLLRLESSREGGAGEEIVAGALRCAVLLVRAVDRIFPPPPAAAAPIADRLAAAGLWQRLEPLAPPVAQAVVHEEPAFHSAPLVKLLCQKSIEAAAADADRAVELADLARFTAERAEGTPALRANAQAHAWGHLGNARRVQGTFRPAPRRSPKPPSFERPAEATIPASSTRCTSSISKPPSAARSGIFPPPSASSTAPWPPTPPAPGPGVSSSNGRKPWKRWTTMKRLSPRCTVPCRSRTATATHACP